MDCAGDVALAGGRYTPVLEVAAARSGVPSGCDSRTCNSDGEYVGGKSCENESSLLGLNDRHNIPWRIEMLRS